MPYLTNYHLAEQQAFALLGPIEATLRELEGRAEHYTTRLAMESHDRAAVLEALRVLAAARAEVERIWRASNPAGQHQEDGRGGRGPREQGAGDGA